MSSEKVEAIKARLMTAVEQACEDVELATGVEVSGISIHFDRIVGLGKAAYGYRVTGLEIELKA
jgi:hypothetical protein